MYVGSVHLVRPLDGEEFSPSSLRCHFINSVIDIGVCVVLYVERGAISQWVPIDGSTIPDNN